MPKFSYTVVNNQNQELNGTINAPNIKNARDELNQLGLSVISIEETPEDQSNSENETSFEFEAFDTTGRKVLGRIKEADKDTAYKRLRTEYNFDIIALYPSDLSENEKQSEKSKGINDLAQNFQAQKANQSPTAELADDSSAQKEYLQKEVEHVLEKTNKFLQDFANEIKPEEQKEIMDQMDKIKLVKSSTNLERIQDLCEQLLKKIQEKDIYLHKEQYLDQKTSVSIEAKKMISDLHKKPTQQIELFKSPKNANPNSITTKLLNLLHKFFEQDPETIKVKEKIRAVNVNLIEYIKLYLQSSTPEEKTEIKSRMHSLYEDRKKLKAQLHEIRHQHQESLKEKISEGELKDISLQLKTLTGWILTFYLTYYFISSYLTSKELIFANAPSGLAIQDTIVFKYLLPIIFLIHIFLGIKTYFIPKNTAFNIIGIPIVFLASLLIIFNF